MQLSTPLHGVQPSQPGSPQHLEVLIASMNMGITCPALAGRLPKFLENWQQLTLDPWVLQVVKGYYIEFTTAPQQYQAPSEIHTSETRCSLIAEEVTELLSKGAIEETQAGPNSFISQIFPVEKKGGGYRPVVNLKELNRFVKAEHFKMEGLHLLPSLMLQGDWMAKIGPQGCLSAGPNSPRPPPISSISMGGQDLPVQVSPIRPISSTQSFYQAAKASGRTTPTDRSKNDHLSGRHSFTPPELRSTRDPCFPSMPTFRGTGALNKQEEITSSPNSADRVFGVPNMLPDTQNSDTIRETPKDPPGCSPPTKPNHIVCERTSKVCRENISYNQSNPSSPIALQGPTEALPPDTPQLAVEKFRTQVELSPAARMDLTWWSEQASQMNGAPILPATPVLVIESDASNMGWGATNGHEQTGGLWSVEEAAHHINYLELIAVFLALKTFTRDQSQCTVLCKSDNVTAVSYLNHKGGLHSDLLCKLAVETWEWCLSWGITLIAEHLPGLDNTTADWESRTNRDRSDWKFNSSVFQVLQQQMGPLEVDLFASRLTALLPRFYSWCPDPEAEATDAFTQNWALHRGYANPPWCLINRCLGQITQQEARMVLITPRWTTQPWFPVALGMLKDYPRLLPNTPDLVTLSVGKRFIIARGIPQLIAWPISGVPSHHRDFLQRLQSSYSLPGDQRLTKVITPCVPNGFLGVSQGIEIPLKDL